MREILFRGKRVDNGEWIEGSLSENDVILGEIIDFNEEFVTHEFWYKVISETVGQFTGLLDKNGKKIFEGDVVKCLMLGHTQVRLYLQGVVEFADGCFGVEFKNPFLDKNLNCNRYRDYVKCFTINNSLEVIGNIYDNPELLEVQND